MNAHWIFFFFFYFFVKVVLWFTTLQLVQFLYQHGRIQRGGGGDRGSGHPWKITKIKVFLAILVQIPWKITKLPSQQSMLGHHRPASETPFKWRFTGGPMMAPFVVTFGSSIPSSTKKECYQTDKTLWIRTWPIWIWLVDCVPRSAWFTRSQLILTTVFFSKRGFRILKSFQKKCFSRKIG